MASALSKRQQQRNERILQDLIKKPGNDRCADCGARNPTWASWNLGVFLCMGCASLHRKLGTHLSKVKSTTLDSWTNEQIETMRKIGNIAANQYWNPDASRHPPPVDLEDSSSEMEHYIRDKYQHARFKSYTKDSAAPGSAPVTRINGQNAPASLSLNTTVKFVSQPSSRAQHFEKPSPAAFARKESASNGNSNGRNSPTSKVMQILGVQPVHETAAKSAGISFNRSPTPISARSISNLEDKLRQLKDMGFANEKRNIEMLRQTNGDMVQTVETLVRLDSSLPQTPASATTPNLQQSAQFGQTLNVNNPFGAMQGPMSAPMDGFGMASRNMSMPTLSHPQSADPQLFPNHTGMNGMQQQQQQQQQPMSAGTNPYLQQQLSGMQQQQPQAQQHQNPPLSVYTQYPNGFMQQGPMSAPILGAQSNPFFQQQQQQMQPQNTGYNPYMNGMQQQQQQQPQQPQTANGLAPLLQQVSLSTQYTPAGQFTPTPQPQQQQQPQHQHQQNFQTQQIYHQQPQSAPYNTSQHSFLYSPAPLAPQTTSSSTSSRLDRSALSALYSQSTALPPPPPSQSSQSSLFSPQLQQQQQPESAGHSNNPFLPANAARLKKAHVSQESVDFGGWQSGRHSPDAFASLSFRQ